MILSMARELYWTIEAVFSKTGSFTAERTQKPNPQAALQKPAITALADMPVFIGVTAEEAYVERLAAD